MKTGYIPKRPMAVAPPAAAGSVRSFCAAIALSAAAGCTGCLTDLSGALCDDAGACASGYFCCLGRCAANGGFCNGCNPANPCDAGAFCCGGVCTPLSTPCDAGCQGQVVWEPGSNTPLSCDGGCKGVAQSCSCDLECCSGQCLANACAATATACAAVGQTCGDWTDCCAGLACDITTKRCVSASSGEYGFFVACGFSDQCIPGMLCDVGPCDGGVRCSGICVGSLDGGGTCSAKGQSCATRPCCCQFSCGPAQTCCLADGQLCVSGQYCCNGTCTRGVCASD